MGTQRTTAQASQEPVRSQAAQVALEAAACMPQRSSSRQKKLQQRVAPQRSVRSSACSTRSNSMPQRSSSRQKKLHSAAAAAHLMSGHYASWPPFFCFLGLLDEWALCLLAPFFFCHLLGASQGYTPDCGGHEQGHSSLGARDMGVDAWSIISIEGTY